MTLYDKAFIIITYISVKIQYRFRKQKGLRGLGEEEKLFSCRKIGKCKRNFKRV